jgi:hypothetical protein
MTEETDNIFGLLWLVSYERFSSNSQLAFSHVTFGFPVNDRTQELEVKARRDELHSDLLHLALVI